MLRIGITQRVEKIADRGERRDCLDQAWISLLWGIECLAIPIANSVEVASAFIETLNIDGIVLTGGNDLAALSNASNAAPERDATEKYLIEVGADRGIPVFGVCRGLQIMANHYEARLHRVSEHVATRHPIVAIDNERFRLSDRDAVNSFHNYGVKAHELGPDLVPLAMAPDGTIEAIAHRSRRQAAVMWHPERDPNDPRDREMIRDFFDPKVN